MLQNNKLPCVKKRIPLWLGVVLCLPLRSGLRRKHQLTDDGRTVGEIQYQGEA